MSDIDSLMKSWDKKVNSKSSDNSSLIDSIMNNIEKQEYDNMAFEIHRLRNKVFWFKSVVAAMVLFGLGAGILMNRMRSDGAQKSVETQLVMNVDDQAFKRADENISHLFNDEKMNFALIGGELVLNEQNNDLSSDGFTKILISTHIVKINLQTNKMETVKNTYVLTVNSEFDMRKNQQGYFWAHEIDKKYISLQQNFEVLMRSSSLHIDDSFLLQYDVPKVISKVETINEKITVLQMVQRI